MIAIRVEHLSLPNVSPGVDYWRAWVEKSTLHPEIIGKRACGRSREQALDHLVCSIAAIALEEVNAQLLDETT